MTLEMPTVGVLAEYIGVDADDAGLPECLKTAGVLVDDFISAAFREVPQSVYNRAVLDTAHALYKRADSVTGTQQIVEVGSLTINRSNRDPMHLSYPVLRRYVLPV